MTDWSLQICDFCSSFVFSVLRISYQMLKLRYKVGDGGVQQAEPLLERKKHRRQSRKKTNQSILDEVDELDDDENLQDKEADPMTQRQ